MIDEKELKNILDLHSKWLCGVKINLQGADLWEADLRGANLQGANLQGANLWKANLCRADLRGADLRGADLRGADLRGADLRGADLWGADLQGANLQGADLRKAKNVPFIPMACPEEGSFIGWKKAGKSIIKLFIPEDALRSSATGRKCRCSKARVLEIQEMDGIKSILSSTESNYDNNFVYTVGEMVSVENFDTDRFHECAPGIHFFINRQEAVEYDI